MFRYDDKKRVTIAFPPEVFECIREKSEDLLIAPEEYIKIAVLNQLHDDYKNCDEYLKKINVRNLV